jgi:hypothetical protein
LVVEEVGWRCWWLVVLSAVLSAVLPAVVSAVVSAIVSAVVSVHRATGGTRPRCEAPTSTLTPNADDDGRRVPSLPGPVLGLREHKPEGNLARLLVCARVAVSGPAIEISVYTLRYVIGLGVSK